MLKLDVIIHERFAGISREVSIINLDDPESFRLEDIRMYDVGYNFYQVQLTYTTLFSYILVINKISFQNI